MKKTSAKPKSGKKKASRAGRVPRAKKTSRRTPRMSRKAPSAKGKKIVKGSLSVAAEQEHVEETKFDTATMPPRAAAVQESGSYPLPQRYHDDRMVLVCRDPWWLYVYWDPSREKINSVISSIPQKSREGVRWVLRVYEVRGGADFSVRDAERFFDLEIQFESGNWYINAGAPEKNWCVELGLKTREGKFFPVLRSNQVKTPSYGVSPEIDEEWALPEEDYLKVLGGGYDVVDMGKSSLQRQEQIAEYLSRMVSSPLASWGISSPSGRGRAPEESFYLEVGTELILYGRTEHDAEVTVDGKNVKLRPDGTFTLRYALPEGDFKFPVVAVSKNRKHRRAETPAVSRYKK
ncbi:MAG: DUF4912 domain-containing protein [Candidatus Omnitrophica bacterium]|nr:DUF4912 domain-containing protein [Candidatus Omnitrophota bacterium]